MCRPVSVVTVMTPPRVIPPSARRYCGSSASAPVPNTVRSATVAEPVMAAAAVTTARASHPMRRAEVRVATIAMTASHAATHPGLVSTQRSTTTSNASCAAARTSAQSGSRPLRTPTSLSRTTAAAPIASATRSVGRAFMCVTGRRACACGPPA